MATAAPLQQVSLRDQALAFLRQSIVAGDIVPGEIYSASSFASQLGVSNSPVREAMLTLVNEGLMETVRNRGFRVVPLSDKDRANIYELRLDLVVPSMGRLAASGRVAGHEARFTELAAGIVAAESREDMVAYLEYDRQFHLGLIELLDNSQLAAIVANLRDQTRLYGLRSLSERGLLAASAAEHQPILDAVVAGDRPLAERLTCEHLQHIQGDWAGRPPREAD